MLLSKCAWDEFQPWQKEISSCMVSKVVFPIDDAPDGSLQLMAPLAVEIHLPWWESFSRWLGDLSGCFTGGFKIGSVSSAQQTPKSEVCLEFANNMLSMIQNVKWWMLLRAVESPNGNSKELVIVNNNVGNSNNNNNGDGNNNSKVKYNNNI
jgi:hypothetical protein